MCCLLQDDKLIQQKEMGSSELCMSSNYHIDIVKKGLITGIVVLLFFVVCVFNFFITKQKKQAEEARLKQQLSEISELVERNQIFD